MQAHAALHKHRHLKTLILLVISMTVGAFFLFWLGQMTPVTPLRGKSKVAASWNQISVRTSSAQAVDTGFFHLRIDEFGRLFQTNAWRAHTADPRKVGTIQVVLSLADTNAGISKTQERALARLIKDLRREFAISAEEIRLDRGPALVSTFDSDRPTSIGL